MPLEVTVTEARGVVPPTAPLSVRAPVAAVTVSPNAPSTVRLVTFPPVVVRVVVAVRVTGLWSWMAPPAVAMTVAAP